MSKLIFKNRFDIMIQNKIGQKISPNFARKVTVIKQNKKSEKAIKYQSRFTRILMVMDDTKNYDALWKPQKGL